jgi:very-short-patch-repair endonuclease
VQTIDWPFLAAEALDSGALTFRELRRFHHAEYPGVWVPRGADLSATQRARAAWLWSRRAGVVAGLSAAAVLGAKWIEPTCPAELVHTNRRPPARLVVHTDELLVGEVQVVDGMPVTTPARTAFDLGRRLSVRDAVPRLDALLHATGVDIADVGAVAAAHPGVRGLRRVSTTLGLVDSGAESPYESLTRLALVRGGLPAPETQIEFRHLHIRVDMGWRAWQVAVEYDGIQHWSDSRQRAWDIERIALLEAAGWTVVRVSADMLTRPERIVDRVRTAMLRRGWLAAA